MTLRDSFYRIQLGLRQRLIARSTLSRFWNPKRSQNVNSPPSQLLFVLSGLLGDSIMSLPAIAAAREHWPETRITVLGKTQNRELTLGDPCIDEFHVFDADPFSLRRSAEISELKKWLAEQQFDAAIILLGDQFAHLLARAQIPIRVGVKGTILEPCLTHSYEIGSPREWGAHERLNCLRTLGADVSVRLPKLHVDPEAAKSSTTKLSECGLRNGEKYIVLHPFGSTRRQWWPLQNIRELQEQADRRAGLRIVLVGGRETLAAEIETDRIVDTRGHLTIQELLAVIDNSELVVTTDSGPFHIAGALGKKVRGLFRSRRPEHASAYPTANVVFGQNRICNTECNWDKCVADPCRQMADIGVNDLFLENDSSS